MIRTVSDELGFNPELGKQTAIHSDFIWTVQISPWNLVKFRYPDSKFRFFFGFEFGRDFIIKVPFWWSNSDSFSVYSDFVPDQSGRSGYIWISTVHIVVSCTNDTLTDCGRTVSSVLSQGGSVGDLGKLLVDVDTGLFRVPALEAWQETRESTKTH